MRNSGAVILGIFFAIGLGVFGFFTGQNNSNHIEYNGRVSVTGVSQKNVKADMVFWTVDFIRNGKTFNDVYKNIEKDKETLAKFLINEGLDESDFRFGTTQVFDKNIGNGYIDVGQNSPDRYTAAQKITVYSSKIDVVKKIFTKIAEFGKENILFAFTPIAGGDYGKLRYFFPKIVDTDLVDNAMLNAKETAERLAKSANKRLGDTVNVYAQDYGEAYDYNYSPYSDVDVKTQVVKVIVDYELK